MNRKGYQARPGFTLWTLKIAQETKGKSQNTICKRQFGGFQSFQHHIFLEVKLRPFNLVVKSVKYWSSYLICESFGFSGQIEAWCGVGVSFPVGGLLPKLSQAAWDLRRTEGPSCVSWYQTHPMGELFCSPWWRAVQRADFWQQQCVKTWLDLLVDDNGEKSQSALQFILPL